jgi:AraC-like DNA-binding protein
VARDASHAVAQPAAPLRRFVYRYTGYRYSGVTPGVHRGLPAPYLAMILSLGAPTRVTRMSHPEQPPDAFMGLVGGLHTQPAEITHNGSMSGLQLDITPAGARSLLGLPSGELGALTVSLDDILGPEAGELHERLAGAPDWTSLFATLDRFLLRRVGSAPEAPAPLTHAWDIILRSGGTATVDGVAREVGWSRRHLGARFAQEFGLTVKEALRVARFHRSRHALQRRPETTIADIAAVSGYADQAHMAREWSRLAGCSPSTWLRTEELPFLQDGGDLDADTED